MRVNYHDIRDDIYTGDLIAFQSIGTLSNRAIAAGQWLANHDDGYGRWRIIHVGCVIANEATDERLLFEFMANCKPGGGMMVNRLSDRIADYPGSVYHIPLNFGYRLMRDLSKVDVWMDEHRDDAYNYRGLPAVESRFLSGRARPGKLFCSEAVVNFWRFISVAPEYVPVITTRGRALAPLYPHRFGTADACRAHYLDWDGLHELYV